jgi:hypothetical protein
MEKQLYISKLTRRFRVGLEESWYHEKAEVRIPDRRWFEIIPCKGFKKGPGEEGSFIGLISEYPPTLQLYSDRLITARKIWQAIKDHSGTRADFALDGEAVLFFPPALLEMVAEMAGARKKRQLSEEHRSKLIEAGKSGREALKKWQVERSKRDQTDQNSNDLPAAMV